MSKTHRSAGLDQIGPKKPYLNEGLLAPFPVPSSFEARIRRKRRKVKITLPKLTCLKSEDTKVE